MTRYEYRLPDIGEGIAEAEIVAWHVKPGDHVEEGTHLADMMTDKATVEMESPVSGTVRDVTGAVGDMLPIGTVFVVIDTEDEIVAPEPAPTPVEPTHEPEVTAMAAPSTPEPALVPGEPAPTPFPSPTRTGARKVLASPSVRARATDLGIDLARIVVSEGERIRHKDLDAFLLHHGGEGYRVGGATRPDEQVKVVGLRRRIAEQMSASKRHIPHFTYVEEIDVTELEAMRADLNANRGDRPKLTLLPFLIVAACKALSDFPMINARYDDEAGIVTRHGAVHMGLATQTDAGLMVPVIRDAQSRNIWQLAAEIVRLAEAARTGKARSEELSGSTLTISSLGPLGGIASTPVINRPEVAILAPNRIVERPVFARTALGGDEIRRAKLMNLSISCDHRVVDGWDAASYIQAVRKLLETPVLLFAP